MITVGEKAPAFALKNQDDRTVRLSQFAGQWVVLYFYPRDDTPGCTKEACEFSADLDSFGELDAVVLGCSPDDPARHRAFIRKHALQLTLLSDPERTVMEQYGAWGEKKLYGRTTVGGDPLDGPHRRGGGRRPSLARRARRRTRREGAGKAAHPARRRGARDLRSGVPPRCARLHASHAESAGVPAHRAPVPHHPHGGGVRPGGTRPHRRRRRGRARGRHLPAAAASGRAREPPHRGRRPEPGDPGQHPLRPRSRSQPGRTRDRRGAPGVRPASVPRRQRLQPGAGPRRRPARLRVRGGQGSVPAGSGGGGFLRGLPRQARTLREGACRAGDARVHQPRAHVARGGAQRRGRAGAARDRAGRRARRRDRFQHGAAARRRVCRARREVLPRRRVRQLRQRAGGRVPQRRAPRAGIPLHGAG